METQNYKQHSRENSVNLAEAFWRLLEQWKLLVCFMLVVLALFLGFMRMRNHRNEPAPQAVQQEQEVKTTEDIMNTLPENERGMVASAYRMAQQKKRTGDYIKNSPVMQIDPYNARVIRISWVVGAEDEKTAAALVMAYRTKIFSGECCQKLQEVSGKEMTLDQIRELMKPNDMMEAESGSFSCDVMLTEDMDGESIKKQLLSLTDDWHKELNSTVAEHTVNSLSCEEMTVSSSDLASKQYTTYSMLYNTSTQLTNIERTFSAQQKSVYTRLTNGEDAASQTQEAAYVPKKTVTPRNILIGLILGAIAYIGLLLLKMMFFGRIYHTNDLKNYPGRTLGEWYEKENDGAVRKLAQDSFVYGKHHRGHLSREEETERSARRIRDICRNSGAKNVLIPVTEKLSQGKESFLLAIKELLSEEVRIDIVSTDRQDVLFDHHDASEIDGIIPVVTAAKTRYKELDELIEEGTDYGIPVLGYLFLG